MTEFVSPAAVKTAIKGEWVAPLICPRCPAHPRQQTPPTMTARAIAVAAGVIEPDQ